MPQNFFNYAPWNSTLNYDKFDVVYGVDIGGTITYDKYYYSLVPSLNSRPSYSYRFDVTSTTRSNGLFRVNYTTTGGAPLFNRGSIVQVSGLFEVSANYTGMVLNAGAGYIEYINTAGYDYSTASPGAIVAPVNPSWTTGFFYTPSYSSPLKVTQSVIESRFGDGYSQRMRAGLNSNNHTWQINLNERSDKEARAILTLIEDKGATEPTQLLIPLTSFSNRPDLKYILKNPEVNQISWNLNNLSVSAEQVFDI